MYSIITTQKGSKGIYFKENIYRLQKTNKNGTTRWVCTNRNCSSSLTIENDTVQFERGKHIHDNVKRPLSIIKTVREIRKKVCDNPSKPINQIYNETLSEYRQTNGTAELIPIFDILRSTLYRDRATVFPKLPRSLNDFILPANFTKNLYHEQMLFCDDKNPSRILAFASLTALKQLAECQTWNADGTFRTAPKLFTQAYTIHVHNQYSMKPIVFSALPNKSEETYVILLQSLVSYAESNNLMLCPTSILIDFEIAAFNAFKRIFPNANILFCYFHFAKNIIKNVKKLAKYIILELTDELKKETVKREVANILSLPLLPPKKVVAAFYDSSDALQSINPNFQSFLNYVEKTYIVNAKFNLLYWNHYSTLSERPRTNNHIEGYHRYLNSRIIAKPNIWKWILHVQKDDEQTIIRTEQEIMQNRSTRPRKKRDITHDLRLADLKNSYQQNLIDIIEYQRKVRSISYKYIDALDNRNVDNEENDD